jgi:hypothetical protein
LTTFDVRESGFVIVADESALGWVLRKAPLTLLSETNVMIQFIPTIFHGETAIEFPRPVTVCRIHDSWDFLKLKVPRLDGEQIAGPSRDGVNIVIEGQIGSLSGELKLSEEEMLSAVEALRTALHTESDQGFALALYRDDLENYRYFKQCVTSRFDVDLSNQRIYSYAVSIHAADPRLHDGLPD